MSFLVQVVASGGGPTHDVCRVKTREQASGVVETLDALFHLWESAGYPENWPDYIRHFEGCGVYALREDGALFSYADDWEPV